MVASLEMRDPRQLRVISVLSLFEQQQERLPPALMADTVLTFDDLPWAAASTCKPSSSVWLIYWWRRCYCC